MNQAKTYTQTFYAIIFFNILCISMSCTPSRLLCMQPRLIKLLRPTKIKVIALTTYCAYRYKETILYETSQRRESPICNPLADALYQKLGYEAQSALEIPLQYHLPIQKAVSEDNGLLAATCKTAILIHENRLIQEPIGLKRYVLLHEALHHRQHHSLQRNALHFSLRVLKYLGKIQLNDKNDQELERIYHIFRSRCEQHAEYVACEHIKCHECLKEVSASINDTRAIHGYYTKAQLQVWELKYKNQNMLCEWHNPE